MDSTPPCIVELIFTELHKFLDSPDAHLPQHNADVSELRSRLGERGSTASPFIGGSGLPGAGIGGAATGINAGTNIELSLIRMALRFAGVAGGTITASPLDSFSAIYRLYSQVQVTDLAVQELVLRPQHSQPSMMIMPSNGRGEDHQQGSIDPQETSYGLFGFMMLYQLYAHQQAPVECLVREYLPIQLKILDGAIRTQTNPSIGTGYDVSTTATIEAVERLADASAAAVCRYRWETGNDLRMHLGKIGSGHGKLERLFARRARSWPGFLGH